MVMFMKYDLLLLDIEEINRPSLHYTGSMIQLVKLPKELKIPFEDLEFEAKMIGEGNVMLVQVCCHAYTYYVLFYS